MNFLNIVYIVLLLTSSYGHAKDGANFKASFSFPSQLYAENVLPLVKPFKNDALFDGTEMGNGGFFIECNKSGLDVAFFYDYLLYLNSKSNLTPSPYSAKSASSVDEIVEKWIANYSKIDRLSAFRLKKYFEDFWSKVIWVETNEWLDKGSSKDTLFLAAFRPIDHILTDYLERTSTYKACQMRQMISFVVTDDDYYYAIKEEDYNRLDNDNRAAAILHELLYHEPNKTGRPSASGTVRFMTAMMSYLHLNYIDREFLPGVRGQNLRARKAAGFSFAQFDEYLIQLNSFSDIEPVVPEEESIYFSVGLYDPYSIKLAYWPVVYVEEAYLFPTEVNIMKGERRWNFKVGGPSKFWPSGKIKESRLLSESEEMPFLGKKTPCHKTVSFDSSGHILDCN